MKKSGKTKKSSHSKQLGGSDPEAADLWRQAMGGVKPLAGRKVNVPDSPPGVEAAPRPAAASPSAPSKEASAAPSAAPVPDKGGHQGPLVLDRRTARNIRRGRMAVEARIDLHGMTQDQAYRTLNSFIGQSAEAGLRLVLVITGKGYTRGEAPMEAGVLRRSVPQWLGQIANRHLVLGHSQAEPKDGGSGAIYVRLRKKK